jgi:hypothetical protein
MMKRAAGRLGAVAAMICMANPCLAQAQTGFDTRPEQSSAFAGLNLRLELGRGSQPTPTARLTVNRMHDWRRTDLPVSQSRDAGPGLELGLTRTGRAELHVGGQPMKRVKERLGADDLGNPVWIVGGIVLLAVGVLVITNLNSLSDDEPAN